MTNPSKVLSAFAIAMSIGIHSASAQIFVTLRPVHPVIVRTVAPSQQHVWIDEEWEERDGHYQWVGGHWEAPREGYTYRPGRWRHDDKRGDSWHPGRWNNKKEHHDNGNHNGEGRGHGNEGKGHDGERR
jgi:hypothetical protein